MLEAIGIKTNMSPSNIADVIAANDLVPILLTWITLNPSIDK